MENQKTTITTVSNDQGQKLSVAGGKYRILISAAETGGSYAVIEMQVAPGGGPAPHSHKDIQEMFYAADGEVSFKMEEGTFKAKQGSFINIPLGGAVHAFKNVSDQPAKLICTVIPGGMDEMFRELSAASPDEARTIGEKYWQKVFPPDFLG